MSTGGHVRVVIDGIDLLAATASTETDGGAFLADITILEIGNENLLEFPDGIVVLFDLLGQISDAATDVDGGGWIGHLHRLEDGANALVGLELFWNALDHECASVERIHVLGRTEPDTAHADHGVPVHVDESEDDQGDDISHRDVSPEPGTLNVPNCEGEENILVRILGHLGVVVDVDGDEDATAEDRDCGEHPADHPEETKECDGVWADLLK